MRFREPALPSSSPPRRLRRCEPLLAAVLEGTAQRVLCASLLCLYSVLLLSVHTASSVSHASDFRCPDRVCLFVYHALSTCTCYASHDVLCALRFSFRRLRVSAPQGPRTGSSSYTYIPFYSYESLATVPSFVSLPLLTVSCGAQ